MTLPVTPAPYQSPYETQIVRFGVGGVDLRSALDALEPGKFRRLTNVGHKAAGELPTRPGLTTLATAGTRHHSLVRLSSHITGTLGTVGLPLQGSPLDDAAFTGVWGIDNNVYTGVNSLTLRDTGYSSHPLALVPHRPPLSSEPWVYIGDRSRMRKININGLVLPIGMLEPEDPAQYEISQVLTTNLAAFDTSDGTEAAQWTGTAGVDDSETPVASGTPTAADVPGLQGAAVEFTFTPGSAPEPYYAFVGHAFASARDLSTLNAGVAVASDDDLMHLYVQIDRPEIVDEIRIYAVVSNDFSVSTLPGTSETNNTVSYVKTFRRSDFADFVSKQQTLAAAADAARERELTDEFLEDRDIRKQEMTDGQRIRQEASVDPQRAAGETLAMGAGAITEYGVFGRPLRRGDFVLVGADPTQTGPGWDAVRGLVIYVKTTDNIAVVVGFDDMFLTGGYGPDTSEPAFTKYDYRYIHYDPRTGAKSNPCPINTTTLAANRQSVVVHCDGHPGGTPIRQRFFRRGGSLTDNWYYLGENTSNGGDFDDTFSDTTASTAGTLQLNNDQPVTTVNELGQTILAQPVRALWGPVAGKLYACGDPFRPGHLYHSKPDEPDHWPADNTTEVCSPSEELMNGCVYGNECYVFSKERLYVAYPNLSGDTDTVTVTPTACKRGLAAPWAFAVGPGGIYFVDREGLWVTTGGEPTLLSWDIDPIFHGRTVEGYPPIDYNDTIGLRVEVMGNEVWLVFANTTGSNQYVWIYHLITRQWRCYQFTNSISMLHAESNATQDVMLLGSTGQGKTWYHIGNDDDGTAIAGQIRTAQLDQGRPRDEKIYGDLVVDADLVANTVTVQTATNAGAFGNSVSLTQTAGERQLRVLSPFGTSPTRARNVGIDLAWSSSNGGPTFYFAGVSSIPQPEQTTLRATQWDKMGHDAESYVIGVVIECDTFGNNKSVVVEYDFNGSVSTATTLTLNSSGRHKFFESWSAVRANLIRLRPEDADTWLLYECTWLTVPEPPRIARWDTHFENKWDVYCTGLDLYCNTFGANKVVEVYIDDALIKTDTVNTSGPLVHHVTFTPTRGHVLRFVSTDGDRGILYAHQWHTEPEPDLQTNWNQNFTVAGTLADKYLKALVFECDTFGTTKTVTVEVDGTTQETLSIVSSGRGVKQVAFPQHLGRVFRVLPTDNNPSRLYSLRWVFDEEPFGLMRWETQETDHGLGGWQLPLYGHIALKSTDVVVLTLTSYNQLGTATVQPYTIPSTGGVKQKVFLPFKPQKGVLFKWVLTSLADFWLYREETEVVIDRIGGEQATTVRPFGNDASDRTRSMVNSSAAAAMTGGGTV